MPSSLVIRFSSPATSICNCSDSTTQGTAMRKKGLSRPTSNPQSFINWIPAYAGMTLGFATADDLQRRLGHALLVLLERGPDERAEERVPVARRRGEFRVVLAAEEPRMVGELRHLGEILGLR